ncbi:MAG: anaerobic carbon-monoxide dehydrogenase catalytic subunit [Candidatus Omnitrophota bacterium]|nr:anaerobic carbon-monoxide dehydrogenase catalytic subunit [Candidatus Omnitrophota bacterium]
MDCLSCHSGEQKPHDEVTRFMYKQARQDGMETIYERFAKQQPQCGFGTLGICCTLCTDGPCQITRKASRGVCGADADLMVARNLLLKCAQGTVANVYHARNVALTLKAVGEGKADYDIADEAKLKRIAGLFGIDGKASSKKLAYELGSFFIQQINSNDYEPLKLTETLALPKRLEVWRKLDILPGGPNSEAATALSKCMTNVNNDPVDLLLHCLRLGIANEYAGLYGITSIQEILTGTASPNIGEVNIGVFDPATVNILAHGHQPLLAIKILEVAASKEYIEKAKKAGASGIKVYGSLCEGQQIFNIAKKYKGVFAGQVGNWIQQEFILATGVVDVMAFDYNCVMPTMADFAAKYHTKMISTDRVIRQRGVERMEYAPDRALVIARDIADKAIEYFGKRPAKTHIPSTKTQAMAGFTTESVVSALGGSVQPLIDAIVSGSIKGVAAVVGCTTVRESQSGRNIKALSEELIKRNILVIGAGCCSSTMQNSHLMLPESAKKAGKKLAGVCESLGIPPCLSYGSCTDIGKIIDTVVAIARTLNVDIPALPVIASAPEYMEQKAVADAFSAVALGITLHLAPAPPVLGSKLVTEVLTETVEGLTGGKVFVDLDPVSTADKMEEVINKKREAMGLKIDKASKK